jgi:hypothetical protein
MKKGLICACVVLGLVASSSSAFATEVQRNSSGQSFSSAWELLATGTDWVMEYGFNKYAIDEDYAHTKHATKSHTAILKNGNGQYSNSDSATNWAEVDVVHAGTAITYSIVYN